MRVGIIVVLITLCMALTLMWWMERQYDPPVQVVKVPEKVWATFEVTREIVHEVPIYQWATAEVTREVEVPVEVPQTVIVIATRTPVPPVHFFDSKTAENLFYPVKNPISEKDKLYDRHNGWYFHVRLTEGLYMLSYGCNSQFDIGSLDGWFNSFDSRNIRLESLYRHGGIYNLVKSSKYRGALMMQVSDTRETIQNTVNIGGGWGKSNDKLYNYLEGDVLLAGDYYLRIGNHCNYDAMRVTICRVFSQDELDKRCPWTGHDRYGVIGGG